MLQPELSNPSHSKKNRHKSAVRNEKVLQKQIAIEARVSSQLRTFTAPKKNEMLHSSDFFF